MYYKLYIVLKRCQESRPKKKQKNAVPESGTAVCLLFGVRRTAAAGCGPRHDHCGYRGSSFIRLATDIVGLVGVSLDILLGPTVFQPVYTAPVCTVPAVQPDNHDPVVHFFSRESAAGPDFSG